MIGKITQWLRPDVNQSKVVLGLSQERILLACEQPRPLFESETCNGQADWPRAITALFNRLHLVDCRVRVFLPAALYQNIQIDRPEVPEHEMSGALPWAVKDFVSESVLQLTFDYYELPTNPAANRRLAVISVPKSRIQLISRAVNAVARLESVTIEELALAELAGQSEQMQLLLYQVAGQDLLLLAVCRGQLCFHRQLRGFTQLSFQAVSNLSQALLDDLSLEIQRSLDYLVAQLKLPEAAHLHVALAAPDLGGLVHYLAGNLGMPVSAMANPAIVAGIHYLPLYGLLHAETAP